MIKRIKNQFWRADEATSSDDNEIQFNLRYEGLNIGTLTYRDEQWRFAYSQEFLQQNDLSPIIDFPNAEQGYFSQNLWPFFAHRIPSRTQPQVKLWVEKYQVPETRSQAELLKQFGTRTAANPYILESSP